MIRLYHHHSRPDNFGQFDQATEVETVLDLAFDANSSPFSRHIMLGDHPHLSGAVIHLVGSSSQNGVAAGYVPRNSNVAVGVTLRLCHDLIDGLLLATH